MYEIIFSHLILVTLLLKILFVNHSFFSILNLRNTKFLSKSLVLFHSYSDLFGIYSMIFLYQLVYTGSTTYNLLLFYVFFILFSYYFTIGHNYKKEKVFLLYNQKHLFPSNYSKNFGCQKPSLESIFLGSSKMTRSAFSSSKCSSL